MNVKRIRRRSKKPGLPPGTLDHVGEERPPETRITRIYYEEGWLEEGEIAAEGVCAACTTGPGVTWINIDNVDIDLLEQMGAELGLHPLVLEDILNTEQRPKLEAFDDHLFIPLKMVTHDPEAGEITVEHVSLIVGPQYVLSFQEREGDVFTPIRQRIRKKKGRIRAAGADYLTYALIDVIVDHYFVALEVFSERSERLEEEVMTDPSQKTIEAIHALKRELILLRRSAWPMREIINGLDREGASLISLNTQIYLRDVYDHAIQAIDTIETLRDVVSGLLDIYLSTISNRMNEVMKVLTIIATIFIPLTLIAGIYGMNFEHMPELDWRWGYPMVWLVMILIGIGMLIYFRRRKWL